MKRTRSEEERRAFRTALLIVGLMAVIAALCVFGDELTQWILPGTAVSVPEANADMPQGLDTVRIEAELTDDHTLRFTQQLSLRNRTGEKQESAVLRTWAGAYASEDTSPVATDELYDAAYPDGFSAGGLAITALRVNGQAADYSYQDSAKTVLRIAAGEWNEESVITVAIDAVLTIPDCAGRFGVSGEIISLGNVFPVPAVWQDGAWRTDAPTAIGDPYLSECMDWTVRFTVPKGYTCAASGYAAPETKDGKTVYTWTCRAMRDFAVTASRAYTEAAKPGSSTVVIVRAKTRASARKLAALAKKALECYESLYGACPWPAVTVAESGMCMSGAEFPGLVMISSSTVKAGGDTLEYAVAHELAHQWWYAAVGSDSVNDPWQDESLCEYAVLTYIGSTKGEEARAQAEWERVEAAMRIVIPRGITPGSPISYFADRTEYHRVVYERGTSLWLALENYLGRAGMNALLRTYAEQYRFAVASREDLTRLISEAAGQDMTGLIVDYLDTYIEN